MNAIESALKRLLDLTVCVFAFFLLSPLMVLLAAGVRVFLGRPILYRQARPGRHGVLFDIYKFRTMTDDRDANGELLPDDRRLTPFGRWMRHWSLDELPQLLNVIKGDLSLVGPRPLLVEYLPLYNQQQAKRHEVKPGITGWAQVNGRNALTWEAKFAYDTWYVEHQSLALDLKILVTTLRQVFTRRGIEGAGNIKFRGSSPGESGG